jgi:PKHD-type hydroxylase
MWYIKKLKYESHAYVHNLFTPDECKSIIEMGLKNLSPAQIANKTIQPDIRKSDVNFIQPNSENEWIFQRITDGILTLNKEIFNFNLEVFPVLQFTRYVSPDGKYDKHMDVNRLTTKRKLSITVQLSESNVYEGGELLLWTSSKPIETLKNLGTMIGFPSYVLHEVTPVTKGTRYSLVAWVEGPQFR